MEAESINSTDAYVRLIGWLHANRKALIVGGGVVAVVAVVYGIMSWQKAENESDADTKLMDIPINSYQDGRVVATPPKPFLDLAKEYPSTSGGEYGELLGAEGLFVDGKYPEALERFTSFINDYPDSPFLAQAKLGLAASLEAQGKISEAAQKYQDLISSYPGEAFIVSPAKLTLARLYEQLNKPEQAFNEYQDLARINNPYDPWVAEARERIQGLLVKHPELRKQTPSSMGAGPANQAGKIAFPNPQSTPSRAPAKP